jgi:spore maturation protein CgeB
MKILLGYNYYKFNGFDSGTWYRAWIRRLRSQGIDVQGIPLSPGKPNFQLTWPELDARWKRGDPQLIKMYDQIAEVIDNFDVFVNFNGINIHPEFVRALPTFNVFGCFDDPENSDNLSKPVAWAYDLSMVGNIAEVENYHNWGVKEARFWPLGFRSEEYNPHLTKNDILNGDRDNDIAVLCERLTGYRAERLNKFVSAFPDGAYYGRGWPKGFLPEAEKIKLYNHTKIGINFHNSTGPINFRTYVLPANGVLQICDNRANLDKIFRVGKEVIGFDTVEEAIELCRYYLENDEERRKIAAAGWERAIKDYNEIAVFQLLIKSVNEISGSPKRQSRSNLKQFLSQQQNNTFHERLTYRLCLPYNVLNNKITLWKGKLL